MKGIPLPERTEDFTADPVESAPSRADRLRGRVVAAVIQVVGGSVTGIALLVTVDVLMALTFALESRHIER